ncbi:kinase-like protein [Rickenella mellea]|uniref:Kinase-like protein n=1 Tax=Rickenella mellea TaxID=50990 RepID=A0A4Y7Q0T9_9AGAM|nr:kinase-like protein [Rickenella mellea]
MSIASDHWESCAEMMKHALEHDLCDFSRVVSNIVGSKRDIIMDLPTEQVRIIMEILQELIDSHFAEHRIFERVLRKVVKTRRILPSYLFLSGVKRSGAYAVTGGGFADVWRGELEGKPVALKVVRVFELNNKATEMHQNFCEEAMMWRQFRHPNILPFLGIYEHEDSLALVSPWMPEGHVGTFLRTHPDANRLEIVRGIANGICYLHGLKPQVVHGDLHPRNILIDSHEQPRIADFGLSKINDSQGTSNMAATSHGGGILRWQAPELLNPERFGHEHARATTCSDVYAFSFICYEIFTDQVPLSNLADVAVLVAVAVHDRRPVRPEGISAITRGLGENMWNLLQSCWKPKADERPTMLEVTRKLSPPHIRSSSNTTNDATLRAEGSPGPQVNSYDDETTYRSKFAFTHLESARRFLSTLPDLDEVTTELNRVGLQYLHFGGPKGTFKVFFERRNKPASFMKVVRIAKVWKDLRHENIAQLYGYCVISRNPGLVHASGTHGNLENYLRSRMHMVTVRTPKKLELLMDVAEGLRYLHSQNLLHGKLRAVSRIPTSSWFWSHNTLQANVHVGNDDRALLCDFSFPITDAGAHNPQIGNDEVEADYVRWLAYELFDEHVSTMRKLTFATDMYSYGCLMHEVLSGELPYYDISIRDVESEKRQKRSPARPDGVSDKPWALMKEFWSADPTSRPNASDVCTMLQELTKQMHMLRV